MEIKRILTFCDEVRSEAGQRTEPPLRKSAVVAVVHNPFAGRYVEDLSPLTVASAAIGKDICTIAVALLGPDASPSRTRTRCMSVRTMTASPSHCTMFPCPMKSR
jgi:hypothetical protein